jgi:putative oxidoreductase
LIKNPYVKGENMADWAAIRLSWEPRILSILRIIAGLLFLQHGLNKLFDFPTTPTHVPYHLDSLVPGIQGLIELIGGVLLVLGLFSRPVAFLLAGDMAAAYFIAHAPRGFFPLQNGGELAVLYCFVFLYLWIAGGGVWALDRLWLRR